MTYFKGQKRKIKSAEFLYKTRGFLNVFIRNADIVKMANMAQLVNVIAQVFAEKDGMFLQTIYYTLQLFANNMFGTSLDVYVGCDTYYTNEFYLGPAEQATWQKDVPYLDVSATYTMAK